MGLIFSVLQSIVDFFRGTRKNDYIHVNAEEKKCLAEKPKLHKACRSTNETNLTPYQNKIDKLKAGEVVYVSFEKSDLSKQK
jgi:hypothetical protein